MEVLFIGTRVGRGSYLQKKREERIICGMEGFFLGGKKGIRVLIIHIASLFYGGWGEDPCDRWPYWFLTWKSKTGWLRLCFWESLGLQLDQVLNLGFVFSNSDTILSLWVFFNKTDPYPALLMFTCGPCLCISLLTPASLPPLTSQTPSQHNSVSVTMPLPQWFHFYLWV